MDEVLFAEHTDNEEDLKWLHQLVDNEPLYRSLAMEGGGYDDVWQQSVDDKNMFIKIDDDIVRLMSFDCTKHTDLLDRCTLATTQ